MEGSIARSGGGFVARGFEALERTTYSLARTRAEAEAIYRLRYRAYLSEGAVDPNEAGMLSDTYDEQSNSFTFGIHYDAALVASMRVQLASPQWRRTSATVNFPDVLDPYLDAGKSLIDPNRFVVDPELGERLPHLPYMAIRLVVLAAIYFGADYGISTPRAEHYAFYKRLMNAKPVSPPRAFPGLKKPVGLLIAETSSAIAYTKLRFPFMAPRAGEPEAVFGGG